MSAAKLVPELQVSDFAASLDFYVRVIGFAVRYDRPAEKFAYVDLDGAELMIEQETDFWLTAARERPYGRGTNLQIEVADLDGIVARLLEADIPLFRPVEEAWYRAGDHYSGNGQFLGRIRTAICCVSSKILVPATDQRAAASSGEDADKRRHTDAARLMSMFKGKAGCTSSMA